MQNCYNTGERIPREKKFEMDDRLANKHIQTLQFVQEVVNENKVLKKKIEELELSTTNCDELHAMAEESKEKIKTVQEQYLKRADEINAMMAEKHREEVRVSDRAVEINAVMTEVPKEEVRVRDRAVEMNAVIAEPPRELVRAVEVNAVTVEPCREKVRVRDRADEINALIAKKHRETVKGQERADELGTMLVGKHRKRTSVRDRASMINAVSANKQTEGMKDKVFETSASAKYRGEIVKETTAGMFGAKMSEEQKRRTLKPSSEIYGAVPEKSKGEGRLRTIHDDTTAEMAKNCRNRTRISPEINDLMVGEHKLEGRVRYISNESYAEMAEKPRRDMMNGRPNGVIAKKASGEGKLRDSADPVKDLMIEKLGNRKVTDGSENTNMMYVEHRVEVEGRMRDISDAEKYEQLRRGEMNSKTDMIDSVNVEKGRGEGKVRDRADAINVHMYKEIGRKQVNRSIRDRVTMFNGKHIGEFSIKVRANDINSMIAKKDRRKVRANPDAWTAMEGEKHRRGKIRGAVGIRVAMFEEYLAEVADEDNGKEAKVLKPVECREEKQLDGKNQAIPPDVHLKDTADENNTRAPGYTEEGQMTGSTDLSVVMPIKDIVDIKVQKGADEIKSIGAQVCSENRFEDSVAGGQVKSSANEINTMLTEEHKEGISDEVKSLPAKSNREGMFKGKSLMINAVIPEMHGMKKQRDQEGAEEISASTDKGDKGELRARNNSVSSMMLEKRRGLGHVKSFLKKVSSTINGKHSNEGQVERNTHGISAIQTDKQIRSSDNEMSESMSGGRATSISYQNNALTTEEFKVESDDEVKSMRSEMCREDILVVKNAEMSEVCRMKKQSDREIAEAISASFADDEVSRDSADLVRALATEANRSMEQPRSSQNKISSRVEEKHTAANGRVRSSANKINEVVAGNLRRLGPANTSTYEINCMSSNVQIKGGQVKKRIHEINAMIARGGLGAGENKPTCN